MNDQELDELLDQWQAPAMRDTVRQNLRAGFAAKPAPVRWRPGRLAFATLAAAVLLFAVFQVSPRTARLASSGFHIPFYVESVFTGYAKDGSARLQTRSTYFVYAGYPINMATIDETGGPLLTAIRRIGASVRIQAALLSPSLVLPKQSPMPEPAWFAGFVRSGCSDHATVLGHEIVAGHETTIVQNDMTVSVMANAKREPRPSVRFTSWRAPDLGCIDLKMTIEERQPDGTYRLSSAKEAVKVTMNP